MLIVLCGKTASGKTLVRNMLKKEGYSPIVTYTTRPPRTGEIDGKSYHFISDEDFERGISEGKFAEYKSYDVYNGDTWYYGCSKESLTKDDNSVIILTPQGYRDIVDDLPDHVCIYLYANRSTISKRLKLRGDPTDEIQRRIKTDEDDFLGFQYQPNVKIVYNNTGTKVEDVIKKIIGLVVRHG